MYYILEDDEIEQQRAEFLLSKCASLTTYLEINLRKEGIFNFKEELINLIQVGLF
jgi:hypothetical protein